ncbi:MAG: threonine synthase [Candidatus Bathyarchaeota archaeon]|nr:threonine synthase [Candidatus Bathyarchaeota archaeon]MDW8039976.1 threonine synthase [Nitrososphaerota archaeon]
MFATAVKCSKCGWEYSPNSVLTVCTKCGGALLFNYDLNKVAEKLSKKNLRRRAASFWKFRELLPIISPRRIVSLGEPYTPLLKLPKKLTSPFKNVYAKDEGRLPTGTFKARGMAVAVSKLKELGVRRLAIPSAGNAAAALAAYGAKAGMEVHAFMPRNTPEIPIRECINLGAKVYIAGGLISDAAMLMSKLKEKYGWFDVSTNKQPYRFEGYKAMAYEIAEQYCWKPPDVIIFPTGGGEGVIGLWKGFKELNELGWINKTPRLIIAQSAGCAPLVEAFHKGKYEIEKPWENAQTIAAGLRVPSPYASYLILRAIRDTNGNAIAVSDEEIIQAMKELLKNGVYACPEAAATLAALNKSLKTHILDWDEKILLCLTGTAMKNFDLLRIDKAKLKMIS